MFLKALYGTQCSAVDNGYTLASLGFSFTYEGIVYVQVSISSNGYVCLGSNAACGSATRPSSSNVLVGLNYDLNPARSGSGKIYYQILGSNSTFFQSACDKINSFDASFVPKFIFMITYDGVYCASGTGLETASFQIFLLADSSKSYVIFQYTSCLNGLSLLTPSGLTFAGSSNEILIEDQCNSTNVKEPGVWAYETIGKNY